MTPLAGSHQHQPVAPVARSVPQPTYTKLWVILAMLTVYVAYIVRDGSSQMQMAALLAVASLFVLIFRAGTRRVNWLETGIVMGVILFVQYANGAVFVHYFPHKFAVRGNIDARLVYDLSLLLGGMVLWLVGYALPIGSRVGRALPILARRVDLDRFIRIWAAAMIGCWVLRIGAQSGWLGGTFVSSYKNLPQILLPIAIMVWVASKATRTGPTRLSTFLVIGFVLEVGYQLPTTMKGNLFWPFLLSIFGVYLVRRRMPTRAFLTLVVAALLYIPIGLVFRNIIFAASGASTRAALAMAFNQSYSGGVEAQIDNIFIYSLGRSQMVDVFDVVVTNVPAVMSYQNGRTYADLPFMLIPRALWPSKPVYNYMKGEWGREIAGVNADAEAVGMGVISEFYFNFGVEGILLGMLLLGIACRAFWAWYVERNLASLPAGMFYLIIIKQFVAMGAAATVIVGMIQFTVLYYLFYRAATLPRPARRLAPQSFVAPRSVTA